MDQEQEQLKRTDEDTACILLEFIEANEQASDARAPRRSRTKSVEKARAVIIDAVRQSHQQSEQLVLEETESEEGFVVLSTKSTQTTSSHCHNNHLSATPTTTCGGTDTCLQRPATLALQPAQDPEDPPLFSPCASYPPGPLNTSGRMPKHTQSSPVLTKCTPKIVRACRDDSASMAQDSATTTADLNRIRSRMIADRLKQIGDKINQTHVRGGVEEEVSSLVTTFSRFSGNVTGGLWPNVTRVFGSIYRLLSLLKSQFGESSPPVGDERWQLFLKTMGLLRDDIVPLISSYGGWGAFLRSTEPCDTPIGSPLLARSLPTAQSSPTFTPAQCTRLFQEYQHSPGSTRSLKITRSNTLPAKYDAHPRKLWRLSESGSLVDEDGNDDFKESLERERESDLEGSGISLDNARRIVESSGDFDNERDDLVFPMQTDETYHHSVSTPVIVPSPHRREMIESEFQCDSGVVSSLETLSISSTPPRDVSFALGSTALLSENNDSAVDISTPQGKEEKKRPRSGCSFSKPKEEVLPFDRARSRSVPMSRRPRSAGNERSYGRLKKKPAQRSSVVVSSAPPCETSYSSGSVSLKLSEAVLYEAVCSLLR